MKRAADPKEPTRNYPTVWLDVDGVVTRRAAQYGVVGWENGHVESSPGCGIGLIAMRFPQEAIQQQARVAAYVMGGQKEVGIIPDADRFDWYPRAGQTKVGGVPLGTFSLQYGWLAGQGGTLNPAQGYGVLPIARSSINMLVDQRASRIGMVSDRRMAAGSDPMSIDASYLPMLDTLIAVECDHGKCAPQFARRGVVVAKFSGTCTTPESLALVWRGQELIIHIDELGGRRTTQIFDPKDGSVWTFSNVRQGGVDPE